MPNRERNPDPESPSQNILHSREIHYLLECKRKTVSGMVKSAGSIPS